MNGIEKIVDRIEAEAKQEAEDIRLAAEAQCGEIKAKYEKAAQDEYWKIVKAGVKSCEQRVQRLGKTAAMESKKSVLALKQEMVSNAFERSKQLITNLPEPEYVSFLARIIAQAVRTGSEEIILNERDKDRCGKAAVKEASKLAESRGLPGKLTLSDRTRPILGGAIVKDGDIEANCTIESLIELCRNDLAPQVAEVMFNGR